MEKALKPLDEFKLTLGQMESQFLMALPSHIDPKKFVRTVLTAVQQTPGLLDVDRQSLYAACMMAATDGLLPDKREGGIIPFKGKATWIPMVAGILKKVRNSGELLSINPDVVHENDVFEYWKDENGDHLKHIPSLESRGEIIAAYAIAKTKSGGTYIEVMNREALDKIKSTSAAARKNEGPWLDWAEEMAKKSVMRRLSKRLPMSTDQVEFLHRDDELFIPAPVSLPKNTPKRLQSLVQGKISEPQTDVLADGQAVPLPTQSEAPINIEGAKK